MTIPLGPLLPTRSSCQPEPPGQGWPKCGSYSALLPVGLAMPVRLPGPRWALTPPFHPYPDRPGGLISVALSLGLPRPGVTRHRCLVESGLSSPQGSSKGARPSGSPREIWIKWKVALGQRQSVARDWTPCADRPNQGAQVSPQTKAEIAGERRATPRLAQKMLRSRNPLHWP